MRPRRWSYGPRVFTSASRNPPTPEEISARRFPLVDLWNIHKQAMGQAVMETYFDSSHGIYDIVYQMRRSCGNSITHWRWSTERFPQ